MKKQKIVPQVRELWETAFLEKVGKEFKTGKTYIETPAGTYMVEIVQDDDADSPNDWENDYAFVVYTHRQFEVERKGFEPRDIYEHTRTVGSMFYDGHYVFTCYAYIHSGVALSVSRAGQFGDQWDVSTTGFVLVKKQKGAWIRNQAFEIAKALCETWNQYLSGDVYGYQLYSPKEDEEDEDDENEIASCWGYYGSEVETIYDDGFRYELKNHVEKRLHLLTPNT